MESGNKVEKRWHVVVSDDDVNTFDYVVEIFRTIIGMESTQAVQAALLVTTNKRFPIKSYSKKDKFKADAVLEHLLKAGLTVELSLR